jgi:hypothetical protein
MIHDHTPAKRINLTSNVRRDPLDEGAAGFKVGAAAGGCCSPFALPFLRVAMCAPFKRPFSSRAVPVRQAGCCSSWPICWWVSRTSPAECALFASSVRPERKRKKPNKYFPCLPRPTETQRAVRASQGFGLMKLALNCQSKCVCKVWIGGSADSSLPAQGMREDGGVLTSRRFAFVRSRPTFGGRGPTGG